MDQRVQVLNELGFQISEEQLAGLGPLADSGYANLLGTLGMKEFESIVQSSVRGQVYTALGEVADIGDMYPDFFRGLLSISGGELPITDVRQDDSGVDYESGRGTVHVSFLYGGKPRAFDLEANCDWLDCDVLTKVNGVLEQEGVEKRFYACWNEFEGMTIFYRDVAWADRFQKLTGCPLFTEPVEPF